MLLKRIAVNDVASCAATTQPLNANVLSRASEILEDVRSQGWAAVERWASELDRNSGSQRVWETTDFARAWAATPGATQALLQRTADRIRQFAFAQRAALGSVEIVQSGLRMGCDWHALQTAGCYVPGGRYPLVSSLLMTAVTARAAGVKTVWAACPAPVEVMLAAAHVAGVDGLLAVGGAQAIGAFAYGVGPVPRADVVVGPGNVWVTAAKQLVSAHVKIDLLAGPSELVVLADESGDPACIAADLLAQAEHDQDARPILVSMSDPLLDAVDRELEQQLTSLPTAATAAAALRNGFAVLVPDLGTGLEVCEQLAPEHLELHVVNADRYAERIHRCGCLFLGPGAGEVLGDYGAGPNHVLPTGGTARFASGLSVLTFLRTQTWLAVDDPQDAVAVADDASQFAALEGLPGHARSAALRRRH